MALRGTTQQQGWEPGHMAEEVILAEKVNWLEMLFGRNGHMAEQVVYGKGHLAKKIVWQNKPFGREWHLAERVIWPKMSFGWKDKTVKGWE